MGLGNWISAHLVLAVVAKLERTTVPGARRIREVAVAADLREADEEKAKGELHFAMEQIEAAPMEMQDCVFFFTSSLGLEPARARWL